MRDLITIETARDAETGELIGLRIGHPSDPCKLLIYARGHLSGCIRDGAEISPSIGQTIRYRACDVVESRTVTLIRKG